MEYAAVIPNKCVWVGCGSHSVQSAVRGEEVPCTRSVSLSPTRTRADYEEQVQIKLLAHSGGVEMYLRAWRSIHEDVGLLSPDPLLLSTLLFRDNPARSGVVPQEEDWRKMLYCGL